MKKWIFVLSFIFLIVAAEAAFRSWLPKHSLSYQIMRYNQSRLLATPGEWAGFGGLVFFNSQGFSDQEWNSAEYQQAGKYRVGFFGGWMGLGLTSGTAQSFTEVYRQSVLNNSVAHPAGQKLFVFNFSQGGLCLKDLTASVRQQVAQYSLDAVFVFMTPDLFSPCVAEVSKPPLWTKSAVLFSIADGFHLYQQDKDPRADLFSRTTGEKTLLAIREQFLDWSQTVSKEFNVDIIPVIIPWPGNTEDSGYWGLAMEREFEISGLTPVSLTRDRQLNDLSLFKNIYMLDYLRTQTMVEALVREMYARGWRQDLQFQH